MAKTDKLRKVLWIILATLSIISLVFGLMKKVGLCASDSTPQNVNSVPFPVGAGWGNNFTSDQISAIVSQLITDQEYQYTHGSSGYSELSYAILREYYSNGSFVVWCYTDIGYSSSVSMGFSSTSTNTTCPLNGSFRFCMNTSTGYVGVRRVYFDSNCNKTSADWYSSGSVNVSASSLEETLPNNTSAIVPNIVKSNYPLYIAHDLTYDNIVWFSNYSSGGGSDSPGFSDAFNEAYQDWIDSDLNPVDTNPPTTDTTPNWLQKILNGLSTINNTVGGGFSTVFGLFGDLKNSISDKIDSFKDSLSGLAGLGSSFYGLGVQEGNFSIGTFLHNLFFCDPQTIEDIWDDSETGAAVNDLKSTMGNIIACYTATPSEHVYWNFDFSNTTLFSNVGVISINFDWYNAIRTPVITLFSVFFFLGFLFLLVRKIPGIISGLSSSSDDK